MKKLSRFLLAVLAISSGTPKLCATEFISNLGNLWPNQGIGPCASLLPGNGGQAAYFSTGAASFTLNSITLEFLVAPDYGEWNSVDLQIYQQVGIAPYPQYSLIGNLNNPTVDGRPTQWPQGRFPNMYTLFIDFHPVGQIGLEPLTAYRVIASVPASSSVIADVLLTESTDYVAATDWGMTLLYPANLKFSVDATIVPEPNALALTILGCLLGFSVQPVRRHWGKESDRRWSLLRYCWE